MGQEHRTVFQIDPDSTLTGPFNDDQLTGFQEALHMDDEGTCYVFERCYREFLRECNGGVPAPKIIRSASGKPYVIDRFFHCRPDLNAEDFSVEIYADIGGVMGVFDFLFDPYLMPFARLSGGDFLCFDYSKQGRPTIVAVDYRCKWQDVKSTFVPAANGRPSRKHTKYGEPIHGELKTDFIADNWDEFVKLFQSSTETLFVPDFQLTKNEAYRATAYDDEGMVMFDSFTDYGDEIRYMRLERQCKEILRKCNGGKPKLPCFDMPNGGIPQRIEYFFHMMKDATDYRAIGQETNDMIIVWSANHFKMGCYMLPFARVASGDLLCFDYTAKGRAKIVLWDHQRSQDEHPVTTFVADNLDELCKMLKPDP